MEMWCPESQHFEDNAFLNYCVLNSIQFSISIPLLVVLAFLIRLYWSGCHIYENDEAVTIYKKCIATITTLLLISWSVYTFEQPISASAVCAALFDCLLWILSAYAIFLESHQLSTWPSLFISGIYLIQLVFCVMMNIASFSQEGSKGLQITSVFISLLAFPLASMVFFKDYYLSKLQSSPVDHKNEFSDGSFSTSQDYRGSVSLQKILRLFPSRLLSTDSNDDRMVRVSGDNARALSSESRKWSISQYFLGVQSVDNKYSSIYTDDNENPIMDPFLSDLQEIEEAYNQQIPNNSEQSQSQTSAMEKVSYHMPVVESALEKHLYSPATINNDVGVIGDLSLCQPRSKSVENSDGIRRQSSDSSSGALQRALDSQKSRLIASNPGLIPRGEIRAGNDLIVRETSDSSQLNNTSTADDPLSRRFAISIHRWGLRKTLSHAGVSSNNLDAFDEQLETSRNQTELNKVISPIKEVNESDSDDDDYNERIVSIDLNNPSEITNQLFLDATSSEQSQIGGKERIKSGSFSAFSPTLNGNNNSSNSAAEYRSEIEFEICVSSIMGSSLSPECGRNLMSSEQEWWGLKKNRRHFQRSVNNSGNAINGNNNSNNSNTSSINNGSGYWSVWKTASEVLALHSALVSIMGDLAPKRPRLRSVIFQTTPYTRHEISDDMRAIAAFLNATLRSPGASHQMALMSFLNINDQVREGNNATTLEDTEGVNNPNNTSQLSGGMSAPIPIETIQGQNSSLSMVAMKSSNQQDKWRKLFVNMRMKLKPREIAVRCRLFEGVVSGGDIASWLIRPQDSKTSTKYARDRIEACVIGQELLNCGLVVAVCSGYDEDDDINPVTESAHVASASYYNMNSIISGAISVMGGSNSAAPAPPSSTNTNSSFVESPTNMDPNSSFIGVDKASLWMLPFSDRPGYVYRFRERSATTQKVGCWSIFGAPIKINVVEWSQCEGDAEEPSRDTMSLPLESAYASSSSNFSASFIGNSFISGTSTNTSKEMKGHIEYLLDITHCGDNWQIWKRFREFEQLGKLLAKEGVRSDVPLPSKSLSKAFGIAISQSALDSRKQGLELYIRSAIEAVIQSHNLAVLEATAQFLDDDHKRLRVN